MRARGREFVATDESAVMAESLLDPVIMKNSQGDGRFANSTRADESDRSKALDEIDYLFDQLVASKEGPRWKRGGFSKYARFRRKMVGTPGVQISDLV